MLKPIVKRDLAINNIVCQIHPTTAGGSKQHPQTQIKTKCLSLHGPQSVRESCGHLHSQINDDDDDDDDDMAYVHVVKLYHQVKTTIPVQNFLHARKQGNSGLTLVWI